MMQNRGFRNWLAPCRQRPFILRSKILGRAACGAARQACLEIPFPGIYAIFVKVVAAVKLPKAVDQVSTPLPLRAVTIRICARSTRRP